MSPPSEPMTFEDLTSAYRVEKKSATLSDARRDLYKAMANLLTSASKEYEKQVGKDPDSIICEGANQRRKHIRQISTEIVELRMQKVSSLALRSAKGADVFVDKLTPEEKEYFNEILESSKKHIDILNRLRGKHNYTVPEIDAAEPETPKLVPVREPTLADIPVDDGPEPIEEQDLEMDEVTEEFPLDEPAEIPEGMPEDIPDVIAEENIEEPVITETEEYIDEKTEDEPETSNWVIRILEDLPTFSGPEKDYSLKKEDIVVMPSIMAEALISGEKAVRITPTI